MRVCGAEKERGVCAANDKAEEETRLADAGLADDEELEEQVRSGRANTHTHECTGPPSVH